MAFKVPAKRRRDSSEAGSQTSRARTPRSYSEARTSTPAAPRTSRHSQRNPGTQLVSRSPISRASTTSSFGPLDPVPGSRAGSSPPTELNFLEDEVAIHDREDNDALNEIVMALDLRNRDTVGCSYYVTREEKIYLMGDVKFGGVEIIERRTWIQMLNDTSGLT